MEEDDRGYSTELWRKMAEWGFMGAVVPKSYGGIGHGLLDLIILMEEIGRALVPGPLLSTLLGAFFIQSAGNEKQKQELLPRLAAGELIIALALNEPGWDLDYRPVTLEAKAGDNGFIINGTKLFVTDAHVADVIICLVKIADTTPESEGTSLLLIESAAPGILHVALDTMASDKQFEVQFHNVQVSAENTMGKTGDGWRYVQSVMQQAALCKCAEMVGAAEFVLEMTVSYAKQRVAFGHPIGSFQAVQHHCAGMATDVDTCRLITYEAAWKLGEGLQCSNEVAMAKAFVSEAYKRIVTTAHQVHGGLGFAKEYDLQLYFRRAKAAELAFGDARFHRQILVKRLGL
jgi:alkylation response protein AidB-like acyl-CoA dehydrogenase